MSIEWDIEELAYRAMGETEEGAEEQINEGDIDQAIYNKYKTDFETYCKIVKDLLPFTQIVKSPLSGNTFHAFVDNQQQRAIVKIDIKRKVKK
jgi:hypothetical protein